MARTLSRNEGNGTFLLFIGKTKEVKKEDIQRTKDQRTLIKKFQPVKRYNYTFMHTHIID